MADELVEDMFAVYNASGKATQPVEVAWPPGLGMGNIVLHCIVLPLRYTMWAVMASLLFVEAPQVAIQPRRRVSDAALGSESGSGHGFGSLGIEQNPGGTTTITSSVRATAHLLYYVGGVFSFWRGFAITVPALIARVVVISSVSSLSGPFLWLFPWLIMRGKRRAVAKFLWRSLIYVAADVGTAQFGIAFTTIVISKPTFKIWYRRLPPFSAIMQIWRPTAVAAAVLCLVQGLPGLVSELCTQITPTETIVEGEGTENAVINVKFSVTGPGMVITCGTWMLAQYVRVKYFIPARMALVRVQASMLPDDEDPIVPMNRYYTGSAVSGILSASRVLTFGEAWRSVSKSDCWRACHLFLKLVLVEEAIRACFAIVMGWDTLKMGEYWNPPALLF